MENYTQEPIQYASLYLQRNGSLVAQVRTDVNGGFLFINIEAGSYDLIVSKLGFSPLKITDVTIVPNKILRLTATVEAHGFDQDTIVFTYNEFQKTTTSQTQQQIKKQCTKRQLRAAKRLERKITH